MSEGLKPFRHDVAWFQTHDAAIEFMLQKLEFTKGTTNWGHQFRFGLFEVSEIDINTIAAPSTPR